MLYSNKVFREHSAVDAYAVGVPRRRWVVGVACGVEAVVVVARGVVAVLQRGESRGAEGRAHGGQPPREVVAAGHGGPARVGHPRGLAEARVVVGGHGLAEGVGDGGGVGVQQAVVGVGVLHALPRVVGGERGGGNMRQDITTADSASVVDANANPCICLAFHHVSKTECKSLSKMVVDCK